MLSNYDVIDDFDDEPQDLSLGEEDNADFDNDFSDDDDSHEEEPEIVEKQEDSDDDSDESIPYDRITEALGEDELEKVLSPLTLVKPEGALFRLLRTEQPRL